MTASPLLAHCQPEAPTAVSIDASSTQAQNTMEVDSADSKTHFVVFELPSMQLVLLAPASVCPAILNAVHPYAQHFDHVLHALKRVWKCYWWLVLQPLMHDPALQSSCHTCHQISCPASCNVGMRDRA